MHSVDWFYAVDLPVHFLCEHPLGSVLGKASYGDYFLIYQGTTVGGSIKGDIIYYDESVKRYFDAYDTRIASHFMLLQS